MHRPITRPQIAKIWATAHDRRLDREALYKMVPGGSISRLSRSQASDLIARLEGPLPTAVDRAGLRKADAGLFPGDRRRPDAATEAQRRLVMYLFQRLGWTRRPHRVRGFLRRMAQVEEVEQLRDRRRTSAIIEALKAMLHRQQRQAARRN
jgi:hypothetical protein